jgi:hypothetical protein
MNALKSVRSCVLLFCVPAACVLAGCGSGDSTTYDPHTDECADDVVQGDIDTGATIDVSEGREIGVTVEYAGDGAYRITTVCDTTLSGYGCLFDLLATAIDGDIDDFGTEDLERSDFVARSPSAPDADDEASVRMLAYTDSTNDVLTLTTSQGAGLRLEAYLDVKYCAGPYVFWTSGGEIQQGSTTITELHPSEE